MRQLPSDWSDASTNRDASTNQGPPKAVSKQQKLEVAKRVLNDSFKRESGPAHTLIPGFWPLEP